MRSMTGKHLKDSRGFTFMDLAIGMVILGLILLPFVRVYDKYRYDRVTGITSKNMATIKKAIEDFYFNFNHYPCPANITLNAEDADYGRSTCATEDLLDSSTDILVGGVPFQNLRIPESATIDGWGNKFTYIVTASQTSAVTFNPGGGAITLQRTATYTDADGALACNYTAPPANFIPGVGHFIVLSHGDQGVGAYTPSGTLVEECPTGADAPLESINCTHDTATYRDRFCAHSTTKDQSYFDDRLIYAAGIPQKIWATTTASVKPNDLFSNVGSVRINARQTDDDFFQALDVAGTLRLQPRIDGTPDQINNNPGNANAQELCDVVIDEDGNWRPDQVVCMRPVSIGGVDPGMQCDNTSGSSVAAGIGSNRALCSVSYPTPAEAPTDCAGKYVIGIGPGGHAICEP